MHCRSGTKRLATMLSAITSAAILTGCATTVPVAVACSPLPPVSQAMMDPAENEYLLANQTTPSSKPADVTPQKSASGKAGP